MLLIDELDRADEPFEAFLLEILSEYQMTVPELGAVARNIRRSSIITSNRTREIHDALKRRCLYAWVDYPDAAARARDRAAQGPRRQRAAGAADRRVRAAARRLDLFKAPGVAETIDWTNALIALDAMSLDPQTVNDTLGVLLKYQDDIAQDADRRCRPHPGRIAGAGVDRLTAGGNDQQLHLASVQSAGTAWAASTTVVVHRIADNVVHFARVLRAAGLPAGPDRVLRALEALEVVGVGRREDVHAALTAVMIDRHEQQAIFDAAFEAFWRDPKLLETPDVPGAAEGQRPWARRGRASARAACRRR